MEGRAAEKGENAMFSRIFQSVVLQMKDCCDRAVGVIDALENIPI